MVKDCGVVYYVGYGEYVSSMVQRHMCFSSSTSHFEFFKGLGSNGIIFNPV